MCEVQRQLASGSTTLRHTPWSVQWFYISGLVHIHLYLSVETKVTCSLLNWILRDGNSGYPSDQNLKYRSAISLPGRNVTPTADGSQHSTSNSRGQIRGKVALWQRSVQQARHWKQSKESISEMLLSMHSSARIAIYDISDHHYVHLR